MSQDMRMAVGDVIGDLETVAFLIGQYAQRGKDNPLVIELCDELSLALGLCIDVRGGGDDR